MARIALDLDDVVCKFTDRLREERSLYMDNHPELTEWDGLAEKAGFRSQQEFWRWLSSSGIYSRLDPVEGAISAIHEMHNAGHDIVFITSRPVEAKFETKVWLRHHLPPGVAYDLHVTRDKTSVRRCDVYLEDAPHHLEALADTFPESRVVRFLRPWNRDMELWDGTVGRTSVETWEEFITCLKYALPGDREARGGEERVVNPSTGGAKGRKLARFDLLPAAPLREVSEHYGRGARKYESRNWERGYEWSLSFAALQRHAWEFWNGEDRDQETGSHHMAAVVFHALALMEFGRTHPELDDRVVTRT